MLFGLALFAAMAHARDLDCYLTVYNTHCATVNVGNCKFEGISSFEDINLHENEVVPALRKDCPDQKPIDPFVLNTTAPVGFFGVYINTPGAYLIPANTAVNIFDIENGQVSLFCVKEQEKEQITEPKDIEQLIINDPSKDAEKVTGPSKDAEKALIMVIRTIAGLLVFVFWLGMIFSVVW